MNASTFTRFSLNFKGEILRKCLNSYVFFILIIVLEFHHWVQLLGLGRFVNTDPDVIVQSLELN